MFDKVVFAGGGHRCWWQAGFWEVLRAEIELRPRVIGAVSMGAFMACLVHANDTKRALAWFEREMSGMRLNVDLLNVFRKDAPVFRQGLIYRKALRALLGGEQFRQLMWQAPEIRVSHAIAPASLTDRQVATQGWRAYRRDAKLVPRGLHAAQAKDEAARFMPGVKRLQDCRGEREMIELLMASSSMPPMFEPVVLDEERAVSGELIDPVPVGTVADVPGQTLVLTTRTYDRKAPVFATRGRIYVQPSQALKFNPWDFTATRNFQRAYELGRADAEAFLRMFGLGEFQGHTAFAGAMLGGGLWPGEQPGRLADEGDDAPMVAGEPGTAVTGMSTEEAPLTLVEQITVIEVERQARVADDAAGADVRALREVLGPEEARDEADGPDAGSMGEQGRRESGAVAHEGRDRDEAGDGRGERRGRESRRGRKGRNRAAAGREDRSAQRAWGGDAGPERRGNRDDRGSRNERADQELDESAAGDWAAADAPAPRTEIDPHTVGDLSDKLFERGRRKGQG